MLLVRHDPFLVAVVALQTVLVAYLGEREKLTRASRPSPMNHVSGKTEKAVRHSLS